MPEKTVSGAVSARRAAALSALVIGIPVQRNVQRRDRAAQLADPAGFVDLRYSADGRADAGSGCASTRVGCETAKGEADANRASPVNVY
jgi:hypothetical protein